MRRRTKIARRLLEAIEPRTLLSAIVYVDPNSPGPAQDGTSWATAYLDLQAALTSAVSGTQIRVADGTYKPTSGTDRTISFQLKKGVSLLGGYAGYGAADPDARDVAANPTILSGDIGVAGSNTDNSYHVVVGVKINSTAVLDGFTIAAGAANGSSTFQYGGGIFNSSGTPTVSNCIFSGNTASYGGGMCNYADTPFFPCAPTLTNCTFSLNTASLRGGGIYNYSLSTFTTASPVLTNCVLSRNTAVNGGAMYNLSSNTSFPSSPILVNCTVSENTAVNGAGIENYSSSPTLTNCIVWANGGSSIDEAQSSTSTVTNTDIEGGYAGVGNFNVDPQFVRSPWAGPDAIFGTTDDDYGDLRLRAGSPLLNVGSNSAIPAGITTDLAGNPRIQDGTVDLGAYEGTFNAAAPKLIYVDVNAVGAGNGTSWSTAFTSLSSAILAATDSDTIRIADGTYKPASGTDRTLSFVLKSGVSLYGGYAGYGAGNPDARDVVAFPTILSGDIGVTDSNTDNSYHVLTAVGIGGAMLDGMTIKLGNANGSGTNQQNGAGLYVTSSSLILTNCTFNGNTAGNSGGGMYNDSSSPTLNNCTFSGNSGGGMYSLSSSPTLTNCTFSANSGSGMSSLSSSPTLTNCAFSTNDTGMSNLSSSPTLTNCTFSANFAGGMHNSSGSATLTNCTFSGNSGSGGMQNAGASPTLTNCTFNGNKASSGGGMYNFSSSSPTLINCDFSGNTASISGGGIYNENSSSPRLTNCTFSGNRASSNGGGIYDYSSSSPALTNCIVWGNGSSPIYNANSGTATVTYCDIQGGYAGIGNIDADPLFVDADGPDNIYGTTDDNLRPQAASPCLDAGSNAAVPAGVTTDVEGNTRFIDIPGIYDPGAIVDMGAYERPLALAATVGAFIVDGPSPTVRFTMNNVLVPASVGAGDVLVRTVLPDGSLGATIPVSGFSADPTSKSISFNFPVSLADGNYRATLLATSVTDTYASSPASDYSFDFFSFGGDANQDRVVDIKDLAILTANWGGANKVFGQGDFNYDGKVDDVDLILASWQLTLAA